jgi:hypothetical protein
VGRALLGFDGGAVAILTVSELKDWLAISGLLLAGDRHASHPHSP